MKAKAITRNNKETFDNSHFYSCFKNLSTKRRNTKESHTFVLVFLFWRAHTQCISLRAIFKSWLSPAHVWVLRLELRFSGLGASVSVGGISRASARIQIHKKVYSQHHINDKTLECLLLSFIKREIISILCTSIVLADLLYSLGLTFILDFWSSGIQVPSSSRQ